MDGLVSVSTGGVGLAYFLEAGVPFGDLCTPASGTTFVAPFGLIGQLGVQVAARSDDRLDRYALR
jgi:hypothetical protein